MCVSSIGSSSLSLGICRERLCGQLDVSGVVSRCVCSQQRLLLIDAPLHNTFLELWTMVHFLVPGLSRPYLHFPLKAPSEESQDYYHKVVIRLHRVRGHATPPRPTALQPRCPAAPCRPAALPRRPAAPPRPATLPPRSLPEKHPRPSADGPRLQWRQGGLSSFR